MGRAQKSYTPAPQVPPEVAERVTLIHEVMAGKRTVSEAARRLGMSRNRFQSILHRGLEALVESVGPQPAGRPAKPKEMASMQAELDRVKRENARLQEQVGASERMLQVVSGMLQGRIRPARQSRARRTPSTSDEKGEESEPRRAMGEIERMRRLGLTVRAAAMALGVHESTVRRWRARSRCGARSIVTRNEPVPASLRKRAEQIVRRLKGQVGAQSLSHSVAGLSRRQAADIKAGTLCQMERERKVALTRVCVTVPGVMRGLDGMHVRGADGAAHALVAADAAVPFRTEVKVGSRYDAELVAQTLDSDIERNGAPLVYRLDRAKAHDAGSVREVLDAHQILLLHGPPRLPRFYGQLERQNREHRAWREELEHLPADQIEPRLREALNALNEVWRRRTLGWKTAYEVWQERPALHVDRKQLREEVSERAARIRSQLQSRGKPADLAQRLAIEQALQARGYLRQIAGGWC